MDEFPHDVRSAAYLILVQPILLEIDMKFIGGAELKHQVGVFRLVLKPRHDAVEMCVGSVSPTALFGDRFQRLRASAPQFFGCLTQIASI